MARPVRGPRGRAVQVSIFTVSRASAGVATSIQPNLRKRADANSPSPDNAAVWERAARLAARTDLILAGGLDPDNVANAIRQVRPWGVDVSSGVERKRGVKDLQKIVAFIDAAKAEGLHAH